MNRYVLAAALAPAAVVTGVVPTAHATMLYGNYDVLSNRWTDAAWIWAAYPCDPGNPGDAGAPINCVRISAMPSPQRGAYYGGVANLTNGQYSYTTDVPDGLRCFGQVLPTRDTYTWDANTLAGIVESRFDVGCFNGPPGMNTWTFALKRM